MKNATECIENTANQMEERIGELEDRNLKMTQVEEVREWRFLKKKRSPRRFHVETDSIRKADVRKMGIPEGEERRTRTESL